MAKKISAAFVVFALLVISAGFARTRVTARAITRQSAAEAAAVKRGEYLVTIIDCSGCHTPLKMGAAGPEPDMERYLSGHPEQMGPLPAATTQRPWDWAGAGTNTAFSGPWGVTYTMNLTPDQNTGLGIWTEDMFVRALRTGKHMGVSRPIMPPMPWQAFRNATDEDLKAIYAYLRTIKPVVNHVQEWQPPAEVASLSGH